MLTQQATTGDFHEDLKAMLPRLRVYALAHDPRFRRRQ